MSNGFSKQYPDSPPPIETIFDLLAVALAARNGDYGSFKRLRAIDRGIEQHRQDVIRTTFLRKVNDIEYELGNLRKAIEASDGTAEQQAEGRIAAVLDTMTKADQSKAWDSILKWNFCGSIEFLLKHYADKKNA